MSRPTPDRPVSVSLSREQTWVAHTAVMKHLQRLVQEGESSSHANEVRKRLESDGTFDREDLQVIETALRRYLCDAPERDVGPAENALATIEPRT